MHYMHAYNFSVLPGSVMKLQGTFAMTSNGDHVQCLKGKLSYSGSRSIFCFQFMFI